MELYKYLFVTILTVCQICITFCGDVESARCRVRCLAQLKKKQSESDEPPGATFEKCFQDLTCTACLQPCGYSFDGLARCLGLCQETEPACAESCNFLWILGKSRPGVCPADDDVTNFGHKCFDVCSSDTDCDSLLKCCNRTCGSTCVLPHNDFIGVPAVPETPMLRERGKAGVVELKWKAVVTNSTFPILYMVQERYNIGKHHSVHHSTEWVQVAQTTATSSVMRDVGAGRWYQWRVASVAINGTRGFSPPSKPYKTNIEPEAPSPPQNLSEGHMIVKDKKVYLTINWLPPKFYDLPVTRYKVFWSRHVKEELELYEDIEEHRKVVPGYVNSYEIENLAPETTYFIQLQAISSYGDERLKSTKIHIYVKTHSLEYGTQNEEPTVYLHEVSLVTLAEVDDITTSESYFNNGLLKSNISWTPPEEFYKYENVRFVVKWSPEVCIAAINTEEDEGLAKTMSATTVDEYFTLYDLLFDCRYTVQLQVLGTGGQVSPVSTVSFQTPSCSGVMVIGDINPDCPTTVPQVPFEPQDLQHSFLIMQTNITARISWQHPTSDVPIIGYRIIWGQATEADQMGNTHIEPETSLTKVISKDATSISVDTLQEATSYIITLQAMSKAGSGKTARIQFTTPVLQPQPLAPPYKAGMDKNTAEKSSMHSSSVSMETWAAEMLHPQEPHDFFSSWSRGNLNTESNIALIIATILITLILKNLLYQR